MKLFWKAGGTAIGSEPIPAPKSITEHIITAGEGDAVILPLHHYWETTMKIPPESVTEYIITEQDGVKVIEFASPPSAGEKLRAFEAARIEAIMVGQGFTRLEITDCTVDGESIKDEVLWVPPSEPLKSSLSEPLPPLSEIKITGYELPPSVGENLRAFDTAAMKITDGSRIHDVTVVKSAEDFKVGDKVFTVIDEDVGYDPRFTAKTMILPESAPLSIDEVTYYSYCKPTYTLSNGEVYVGLWLALAPKPDFIGFQAFADEEYDPEKVMEAIRKSSGD